MNRPVEASPDVCEEVEKDMPVAIGAVDVLAAIAACSDMVKRAGELHSKRSGHARETASGGRQAEVSDPAAGAVRPFDWTTCCFTVSPIPARLPRHKQQPGRR